MLISNDLTRNDHVNFITSKIHSNLFFLYNKCYTLPLKIKINLVTSTIFPILDYCCLVFSSLSDYLLNKLTVALNGAIRFIFRLRKHVSITPYRKRLQWLDISSRHKYFLGVLTFKILVNQRPEYLYDNLQKFFSLDRRNTRQNSLFDPPFTRSVTYCKSFSLTAMDNWNKIPSNLRKIDHEKLKRVIALSDSLQKVSLRLTTLLMARKKAERVVERNDTFCKESLSATTL